MGEKIINLIKKIFSRKVACFYGQKERKWLHDFGR